MNFDEKVVDRIKQLEREVERLRVKESPGAWLDWTPTVTGWVAGYTCIARYCKVGKMCFVYLYISGTSNAANASATLPLPVSGEPRFSYIQVPVFSDNSIYDYIGGQCFAQVRPSDEGASPNEVWFWLDGSVNGWTASGGKYVQTSLFYEVA
jgi:hypothetical protein